MRLDMDMILVVTPTLGASRFIDKTAESIAQIGEACRHVLVAPERECEALRVRFPGTRVIPESGRGMYGAINTGVFTFPDFEWFTYLNDDDVLNAGFGVLLAQVAKSGFQGIAYGGVSLIDAMGRTLGEIPVSGSPADLIPLLAQRIMPFAQPGTLIHRSVFERIGAFDDSFLLTGDFDFFARALMADIPFLYCSERVAGFRLIDGQLSKDGCGMEQESDRVFDYVRGKAVSSWRKRAALFRFRSQNLSAYVHRIRRFGFMRMKSFYRLG